MTDRYERIRDALAMGPTPGPWAVAVRNIPWSMADGSTGVHVERIILTGWDHPQAHGPVSVVSKWLGIGEEGGPGAQFVRIQEADARLIAACDPDTIRELLAERDQLAAALEAAREDAERLDWLASEAQPLWGSRARGGYELPYFDITSGRECCDPGDLRAAIDQARGKESGNG